MSDRECEGWIGLQYQAEPGAVDPYFPPWGFPFAPWGFRYL